jgi:lysophospholipase L1-like esterase
MIKHLLTLVIAVLAFQFIQAQGMVGDTTYVKHRGFKLNTDLYNIYKTESPNIVMLGNSITAGINWDEALGRQDIVNRGISGDITAGFYNRLDNIIGLKPKVCFIMGGVNDLYNDYSPEDVFQNYKKIVEKLQANNIQAVIQSTLNVSTWKRADEKNPLIDELNALLIKYAAENNIIYVNLNDVLSKDGKLIEAYTYDGLHLNAEGYKQWIAVLEQELKKLGL